MTQHVSDGIFRTFTLFVSAAVMLSGCGTPLPTVSPDEYRQHLSGPPGLCHVIVFRHRVSPFALKSVITIGSEQRILMDDEFTRFDLRPGAYDIAVTWPTAGGMPLAKTSIVAKSGETRFIRIVTRMGELESVGIVGTTAIPEIGASSNAIIEVPRENAEPDMAFTAYTENIRRH